MILKLASLSWIIFIDIYSWTSFNVYFKKQKYQGYFYGLKEPKQYSIIERKKEATVL